MRKALILLMLLLAPLVFAATPTPDPGAVREQAIVQSIQAENEQTREYIKAFGEETHEMYIRERANAEKEISSILMKFKFTLAITVFCAVLAALEVHALLNKRREKKYRPITVAVAEQMQDKPPIPLSTPTGRSVSLAESTPRPPMPPAPSPPKPQKKKRWWRRKA